MADAIPGGIWRPHEAFYLEAMLHCTTAALRAADEVSAALRAGGSLASSAEWQESALTIISGVQAVVLEAATISRYFWPARRTSPTCHELRVSGQDSGCLRVALYGVGRYETASNTLTRGSTSSARSCLPA